MLAIERANTKMTCAFSVPERTEVRNVIERVWRPHLSVAERDFLRYVADNSIEWGRDVLSVTVDQMLNGIPSDDPVWPWRLPPIGLPRRSLERLIQCLRAKGAIIVEAIRHKCTLIRLNFTWAPMEGMMTLAVPKRISQATNQSPELDFGSFIPAIVAVNQSTSPAAITAKSVPIPARLADNNRHDGVPIKQTDKQTDKQTENDLPAAPEVSLLSVPKIRLRTRPAKITTPEERTPPPVAPPPSPEARVRELAADAMSRSAVARQEAATHNRSRDTGEAYQVTFRAAWAETHQGDAVPTWSKKEMFMVRSTLAAHFQNDVEARHNFLDFVVRNWAAIVASKFNWMRQSPPPALPKIGFVCAEKILPFFLDAYADRRRYLATQTLPAEEREIARLMASGMSRDDALIAMGRRQGKAAAKVSIDELKAAKGDYFRRAEELRKQKDLAIREARRRAAEAARQPTPAPIVNIPAGPDFIVPDVPKLEALPPFDLSKWN